ncbi:hypothetical protein J1614_000041 [Plenodomus biglobosus]|nr:hypothetical protein J1614_000041 [Plenodomus biglobosus]
MSLSSSVEDKDVPSHRGWSYSTTGEHRQATPSVPERRSDTRLRAGKEVELHTWDGPEDPENPFNWSFTYKWILTVTICFISILTGLPAGSYGAGNDSMADRFNVQNEPFQNLYWATCSWNVGAALFPLVFVPLTENTSRIRLGNN